MIDRICHEDVWFAMDYCIHNVTPLLKVCDWLSALCISVCCAQLVLPQPMTHHCMDRSGCQPLCQGTKTLVAELVGVSFFLLKLSRLSSPFTGRVEITQHSKKKGRRRATDRDSCTPHAPVMRVNACTCAMYSLATLARCSGS